MLSIFTRAGGKKNLEMCMSSEYQIFHRLQVECKECNICPRVHHVIESHRKTFAIKSFNFHCTFTTRSA